VISLERFPSKEVLYGRVNCDVSVMSWTPH